MLTTEITATMTSLELVDLINAARKHEALESGAAKPPPELLHKNFLARIENHPGITSAKFLAYVDVAGPNGSVRKSKCYRLPKREAELMAMSESTTVQTRVYDRMVELERAVAPAPIDLADPVALRALLLGYSEKVITLEAKVSSDAPKVAFAEAIRAVDGVCNIEKIAKTIGIGRNKLFRRLRDDGILMSNNLPYQRYIEREYFTVIEQEPFVDSKGVTHPTFTTMVTGAGQLFLAKKYANIMGAT